MEEWFIPLCIVLLVLVYAGCISWYAYRLDLDLPGTNARWYVDYIRQMARLRRSLLAGMLIVGAHAVTFFPFSLIGSMQHVAALFGGVDLVCAIALYGLWRWCNRLSLRAMSRFPKEAPAQRSFKN
jgi:hypothetical protein